MIVLLWLMVVPHVSISTLQVDLSVAGVTDPVEWLIPVLLLETARHNILLQLARNALCPE